MKTTLPRGRMSGLALVASAILMWGAPAASAADAPGAQSAAAAQGIVNAVGYLPLPDRPVLMVRPLDNSDDNMKIKTEIENTLRARGYGVAASSPLVLSFDTRNEVGAWSETDRRTILELKAEGGREGGEYAHAKVNIFDSAAGGLLNKGHGGTSIATPSAYRIDVTLDDKSNGKRLWQGWAVANLSYGNPAELSRAMVPVLMQRLGQTATRQPFSLQ